MDAAGAIEKLGFRRWYERRLVEAHAWLVACLLGAIGLFGGLEALNLRGAGLAPVLTLLFTFASGFLAWHALMRYAVLMVEAHRYSSGSTCAGCGAWGKIRVLRQAPVIEVACTACQHRWRIGAPG